MEGHTVVFDYQFLEDFGKPDDQGLVYIALSTSSIALHVVHRYTECEGYTWDMGELYIID